MRYLLALLLVCALPGFAKDKPQRNYQDGILVSFRTVTTGTSCNHEAKTTGNVDAHTSEQGSTSGTVQADTKGSTDCSNTYERLYTVQSGGNTYVLEYEGAAFYRPSVLAKSLPGTQVKVASDGKHFYVRIGKKESKFQIVEAK